MMGEVVGKAASICVKNGCQPRDVYATYFYELKDLMQLPGRARRATVHDAIDPNAALPDIALHPAPRRMPGGGGGSGKGIDPKKLEGIVVDDAAARLTGDWATGSNLDGFVGEAYRYASGGGTPEKTAAFEFQAPTSGQYEVRFYYAAHENRSHDAPVTVHSADGEKTIAVNESVPAPGKGFIVLGTFRFEAGKPASVSVTTRGATGTVSVDAIQLVPVK